MKNSHPKQTKNRKKLYIISGLALVVLAALAYYAVASLHVWGKAYDEATQYEQSFNELVNKQLSVETKSPEDTQKALKPFYDELQKTGHKKLCTVPYAMQWQKSLWLTRDTREKCDAVIKTQQASNQQLAGLYSYVFESTTLLSTVQSGLKEASNKAKDYPAAKAVIQSTIGTIKAKKVPESVSALQKKTVEILESTLAAYAPLEEADKKEDRVKFDEASANLGKAFDTVATLTDVARDNYTPLLEAALKTVKN